MEHFFIFYQFKYSAQPKSEIGTQSQNLKVSEKSGPQKQLRTLLCHRKV